jgi:hypothetical protein
MGNSPVISCTESNNSPAWGVWNLFNWKIIPERFGGGKKYIQSFKDAWVQRNKTKIIDCANAHRFPAPLLAGVCWIEVGGDPTFIDRAAFEVRSFDWSGPEWVDRNLTIFKNPSLTSFGAVSMQLRTAVQTIGLDPTTMTQADFRKLASCLEKDVYNIRLAAKHLRQLIDHDKLQTSPPALTQEAIRYAGARYNRGIGLPLANIKQNTSYGDFILRIWNRLEKLLK